MQCSISECKSKAIESVQISFREKRNLCKQHFELYQNKEQKHSINFTKASKFK